MDREKRQRPTRAFLGDDVTEFAELAKRTHADTQGSYTGDPLYDEQPVQDVDDL